MMDRKKQFLEVCTELSEIFEKKNNAYGDDYFSGGYSDVERWMSIRRKIARLQAFYDGKTEGLPDETTDDTWKDLAIYCVMELIKRESERNGL